MARRLLGAARLTPTQDDNPLVSPTTPMRIGADVTRAVKDNVTAGLPITYDGVRGAAVQSFRDNAPMTSALVETVGDVVGGVVSRPRRTPKPTGSGGGRGRGRRPRPRPDNGGNGGNGNGNGRKPNYGSSNQMPEFSPLSTSAYGELNSGKEYRISSGRDTTYWYNVFQNQTFSYETGNLSRTAFSVIDVDSEKVFTHENDGTGTEKNLLAEINLTAIFQHNLSQIIGETGGNASVRHTMTYENYWKYIKTAYSAFCRLAEVYSLRSWNPPMTETNTVIRSLKNVVCENIELMQSCLRLEEALAQYALPTELMTIAISLFQTYKKSPVEGGVHCRYITKQMCHDILRDTSDNTFSSVITALDHLSEELTNTVPPQTGGTSWSHHAGVLTSFLLQKAKGYASCRVSKVGAGYPIYDANMNAIRNNERFLWTISGNEKVSIAPSNANNHVLQIAFPMNKDNVPTFVSASLLNNFAGGDINQCIGFPFYSLGSIGLTGMQKDASRFIGVNDTSKYFDIHLIDVNSVWEAVTDDSYQIAYTGTVADFKPQGLNTQLFQPTYEVVNNASRDWLYQVFSMPSQS